MEKSGYRLHTESSYGLKIRERKFVRKSHRISVSMFYKCTYVLKQFVMSWARTVDRFSCVYDTSHANLVLIFVLVKHELHASVHALRPTIGLQRINIRVPVCCQRESPGSDGL